MSANATGGRLLLGSEDGQKVTALVETHDRVQVRARRHTLKRVEPHRLAALVLEDLHRYPESAISEFQRRINGDIHPKQIKRVLEEFIGRGSVRIEGTTC